MKLPNLLAIIAVFCLTASLHAAYINTDLLWDGDFSTETGVSKANPELLSHFVPKAGPDGSGALVFKSQNFDTDWIEIPLDAAKFSGMIQLEALVSGKDLKGGRFVYHGSKVMLHYTGPNGSTVWPEAPKQYGTYTWTNTGLVHMIPEGSKNLILSLGVQGAAGEFRIAGLRIYRCIEGDASNEKAPRNRIAEQIPHGPGFGTRFRGFMSGYDMSPEAFQQLEKWGANLIRYQILPKLNTNIPKPTTAEQYIAWIKAEIEELDKRLVLCRKHGIKVVIDIHSGPGNLITDVASNNIAKGLNIPVLAQAWRMIAEHYRGNDLIYGYDILNEPVNNTAAYWHDVAQTCTNAIREVDKDTPVIVAGNFGVGAFGDLVPIKDKNVIYTVHFYEPFAFTHQHVGGPSIPWSYPGKINGVYWNKEQLRVSMQDAIMFQRKYNVRIYVGEFSAIVWAKGADQYLKDIIELFEEYGWDWTYHAFREWEAWSIEYVVKEGRSIIPSNDNPRMRAVLGGLAKNKR